MAIQDPVSILVVDDDALLARSIQILLEDEGRYRVTVVSAPDQALTDLDAGRLFNLLIVDLAILEGHHPRIQNRRGRVPVIVMTAHEAALDAAHTRGLAASGFLSKPIDPDRLLEMVHTVLRNESPDTGHAPSN